MTDDLESWVLEAGRGVEDPASFRGLISLGIASEEICDAALDVAEIVFRDIDIHPVFAQAVLESDEVVAAVTVDSGSDLAGRTVGDLGDAADGGVIPIAHRRDRSWSTDPADDTALEPGDVLVVRGSRAGVRELRRVAE